MGVWLGRGQGDAFEHGERGGKGEWEAQREREALVRVDSDGSTTSSTDSLLSTTSSSANDCDSLFSRDGGLDAEARRRFSTASSVDGDEKEQDMRHKPVMHRQESSTSSGGGSGFSDAQTPTMEVSAPALTSTSTTMASNADRSNAASPATTLKLKRAVQKPTHVEQGFPWSLTSTSTQQLRRGSREGVLGEITQLNCTTPSDIFHDDYTTAAEEKKLASLPPSSSSLTPIEDSPHSVPRRRLEGGDVKRTPPVCIAATKQQQQAATGQYPLSAHSIPSSSSNKQHSFKQSSSLEPTAISSQPASSASPGVHSQSERPAANKPDRERDMAAMTATPHQQQYGDVAQHSPFRYSPPSTQNPFESTSARSATSASVPSSPITRSLRAEQSSNSQPPSTSHSVYAAPGALSSAAMSSLTARARHFSLDSSRSPPSSSGGMTAASTRPWVRMDDDNLSVRSGKSAVSSSDGSGVDEPNDSLSVMSPCCPPPIPFLSTNPQPAGCKIQVDASASDHFDVIATLPGFTLENITLALKRNGSLHILADRYDDLCPSSSCPAAFVSPPSTASSGGRMLSSSASYSSSGASSCGSASSGCSVHSGAGGHFEKLVELGESAIGSKVTAEFDGKRLKVVVQKRDPLCFSSSPRSSTLSSSSSSSASAAYHRRGDSGRQNIGRLA